MAEEIEYDIRKEEIDDSDKDRDFVCSESSSESESNLEYCFLKRNMDEPIEENLSLIQDVFGLIAPHIPCDQSKVVTVKYAKIKYADRYGSTFLRLKIELVNTTTGEQWTLRALAKTLPERSIAHDISEVQAIFKNEVSIYVTARHAINTFLKEKGFPNGEDFFINTFGGRINLNGTSEIDHNAALIVKDCQNYGYKMVHRRTGFDLDTTKIILATMAKFHGTTLAFKLHKPQAFKDKVLPYLGKFFMSGTFAGIARGHMISILKNEGFSQGIIERAVTIFDRNLTGEVREPWATFTHTNLWIRNIFVKFDRLQQPQDVKFKGLQESDYNSPLRDLIFFLFSSVQLVVLRQHLDDFIDFYYYHLLGVLRELDVVTTPFCRLSFNKELKATASGGEFYKTVCMLYPILGTSNIEDDAYVSDLKDPLHINRLCYIVREFDKRDWLTSSKS